MITIAITEQEIKSKLEELGVELLRGNIHAIEDYLESCAYAYASACLQDLTKEIAIEYINELAKCHECHMTTSPQANAG